jgi:hypothetical protein
MLQLLRHHPFSLKDFRIARHDFYLWSRPLTQSVNSESASQYGFDNSLPERRHV